MTDEKKERLKQISIHAAQEGCDLTPDAKAGGAFDFNPRSPRGLRHALANANRIITNFNPRSPRGLRPVMLVQAAAQTQISIHAAQEGCDTAACK